MKAPSSNLPSLLVRADAPVVKRPPEFRNIGAVPPEASASGVPSNKPINPLHSAASRRLRTGYRQR